MNLFSLNSIRNMASPGEELYKLSGAPIDADTFIIQGSSDQSERLMDGENVTELTEIELEKVRFAKGVFAPKGHIYYPIVFPKELDSRVPIIQGIRETC